MHHFANENLEAQGLIKVDAPAFSPDKKYQKCWLPGQAPYKISEAGAVFFRWDGPDKKVEYTVPWTTLFSTNEIPQDKVSNFKSIDYPEVPPPHQEVPAGMKLVWDTSVPLPGAMKFIPIGTDTRSFEDKVLGKLDEILAKLK